MSWFIRVLLAGIISLAALETASASLPRQSTVEASVSDAGTGIPEDKLCEIFDAFYTTKEHSTGLGLSIARTIVETYGKKSGPKTVLKAVLYFASPCR